MADSDRQAVGEAEPEETSGDRPVTRILVATGEASGDLHGARLISALREDSDSRPGAQHLGELEVYGIGSDELAAAGMRLVADSRAIAVIGLIEALRVVPHAFRIQRRLLAEVERRRPDVALLIDAPDFNLRLAKKLARRGIPVVYFISPQVWAWRQSRVHLIRRIVDKMLVLFPFEADFYRQHDVPVEHVGHPLVDEIAARPQRWDEAPTMPSPTGGPESLSGRTVVLLPGSRRSEVGRLLPLMLEVGSRLVASGARVRLIVARSLDGDWLRATAQEARPEGFGAIELVEANRHDAIAEAHVALCASGTATLEVGLLRTPMVVVYKVAPLTYWLGRRLVAVPHIALVNLVLGRRAVPEILQGEAEPEAVEAAVRELARGGEATETMRRHLAELREKLGQPGAARRAAVAVRDLVIERRRQRGDAPP
ncbi:MAG: lipid-A-disaccharide synthase [Acidobacteria bacterium]|nr:MAG: lipid-A-disaccharide synthase [Acidobacteriota bacterium]REK01042.1 MAG: lipid-A-disaccharide synthase [Acidobacteriota bacterium]